MLFCCLDSSFLLPSSLFVSLFLSFLKFNLKLLDFFVSNKNNKTTDYRFFVVQSKSFSKVDALNLLQILSIVHFQQMWYK